MSFTLAVSDINFIRPLFGYLNIFLITPWYDFKNDVFYRTRLSKIYGCILIFEKLFWIWFVTTKFGSTGEKFNNDLFSLKFVGFLWTSIIVLRTFLIVLKSTFWNVTKWRILITNLKLVDSKLQNVGRRATILGNFYLRLLVEHLIFGAYAAYLITTWSEVLGLSVLDTLYVGPMIDFYRELLMVLLMNLLVNGMTRRYKDLNARVKKSSRDSKVLKEIATLTRAYRILGETIDAFSDIFGYQMILVIFYFGLAIIACLNHIFIVFVHFSDDLFYKFLISTIVTMVFATRNFLMIVLPMHSTVRESKKFIDLSYKLREQFVEGSQEKEALTKSIASSENFHREFTAAGFFSVNKGIIFSAIGNIATYFIITIQLNESEMNKDSTIL